MNNKQFQTLVEITIKLMEENKFIYISNYGLHIPIETFIETNKKISDIQEYIKRNQEASKFLNNIVMKSEIAENSTLQNALISVAEAAKININKSIPIKDTETILNYLTTGISTFIDIAKKKNTFISAMYSIKNKFKRFNYEDYNTVEVNAESLIHGLPDKSSYYSNAIYKIADAISAHQDLTQKIVAQRMGVDETTLSKILNLNKRPSRDMIIKLAIALEFSEVEVLELLKVAGYYIIGDNKRDAIILIGIENNFDLLSINSMLEKYGLKGL